MRHINLAELKELALQSKDNIIAKANNLGREVTVYLHWSAGHYGSFFDDYHINIDDDGLLYVSCNDLSELKEHTWHRNTGAIGVALAACFEATTDNWGSEPPTTEQIEAMAQVTVVLSEALGFPIDADHVMTHAEAADLDGYGPATTWERWDLHMFPKVEPGQGGNTLRGKALWYQQHGI